MDEPTDTSIASRTRSQKPTIQNSSSDEITSTIHQGKSEDFSNLNTNSNEIPGQKQEQQMEQIDKDTHSLSSMHLSQQNELKDEQLNHLSHSNIQIHQLHEIFTIQLAEKQKTIDEQQQLLLQLQLNIQELMQMKQNQVHQEALMRDIIQNHNVHHDPNPSSTSRTELRSNCTRIENNSFKYDNFIEQQLLKEKINNIRKFSGSKQDDIDEWLENIEHDFSSTLVSDDIKLKIIPKSLTNDAASWFEQNKHRLTLWKIFKIEIQHRFQSSLHKDQKFIRLRERKQQLKETGQQFIDAMEKLCFQVNSSMAEHEKMLHIKAGLKPSLKEKVWEKQPESMSELRNTVKRIEDIQVMLNGGDVNNDRMEHQLPSSNFGQPSSSLDVIQPPQQDGNCYALPSRSNTPHYRRDGYNYQHHPQRAMNQRRYQSNQDYQIRDQYEQPWNDHQSNYRTQSGSYLPRQPRPTTNNFSKKY